MIPDKFTDVLLLVIGEDRTYRYHHMADPNKTRFRDAKGRVYHIDLTKSYHIHGWSPWRRSNWRNPFSLVSEWSWRTTHKVALLIFPDESPAEGQLIEPIVAFEPEAGDYIDIAPRGYEGAIESKVPIAYYRKWATNSGKIPLYVWVLLAVLVLVVFVFVLR